MLKSHSDFEVSDSGLVVNPVWTHIGASPDGTVCCACCSKGVVVELKCPCCHRNESVYDSATTDKNFYLKKCLDDTLRLDRVHSYYYQVQTQIIVCGVEYCEFALCTFPENNELEIFCERIQADQNFWTQCLTKSTDSFKFVSYQNCLYVGTLTRIAWLVVHKAFCLLFLRISILYTIWPIQCKKF